MLFSLSLLGSLLLSGVQASNVLTLTPSNFSDVVEKGKPGLVEFFAPWCGHCKNLAPTYEQLADAYTHAKEKIYIAKVDADGEGRELGQKYGVTGFPTLKWFDGKGSEPETYDGGRDLDAFTTFIAEKTGVKSNIKPPPPGATLILNTNTFDEVVMDKDSDVIVAFTAPWCGHCKRMKPIYEQVAQTFLPEKKCIIANVDADDDINRPLAMKYKISSFPTIIFFPKDDKKGVPYEGGRDEADFVNFLNEKCGAQRAVGGGLSDEAGRIPEFDSLASKFFTATVDARNSLFEEATLLASSADKTAQHYLRVMQKVINGSEEYLAKESKRLASIIGKRSLSAEKLDEIKVRANILASFAEKKAQEAGEAAAEATDKIKDEL